MLPNRLQLQRLELKYLVNETTAAGVRGFVQSFLEPDEYAAANGGFSYPVHSLYLDSKDLRTYWDTINGSKNRFKLRIRYYDQHEASPVFFEIKRRMNEAILKQRGGVRRGAVDSLLAGQMPEGRHLLSDHPRELAALERFSYLMLDLGASPKSHVAYLREAWVSTSDNSIRVTMDREVCCAPEFSSRLSEGLQGGVKPFGEKVILELKFTGRFPNWFRDVVETFGLQRCSAAKYADGVTMLDPAQLACSARVAGAMANSGP